MEFKNVLWTLTGCFLVGCQNKTNDQEPKIEIVSSGPKYKIEKSGLQKDSVNIKEKINKFISIDQNNNKINLKNILDKGPIVFIGILYGCPCNEKAQPIINNLAKKYINKATFIGLMPGKKKYLSKYSQKTKSIHPIILDDQKSMISMLQMKSSGFMTLIGRKGEIIKNWPGYSADILKELNKDLSSLTNTIFTPFDAQYAPLEITCGCPYAKHH